MKSQWRLSPCAQSGRIVAAAQVGPEQAVDAIEHVLRAQDFPTPGQFGGEHAGLGRQSRAACAW